MVNIFRDTEKNIIVKKPQPSKLYRNIKLHKANKPDRRVVSYNNASKKNCELNVVLLLLDILLLKNSIN